MAKAELRVLDGYDAWGPGVRVGRLSRGGGAEIPVLVRAVVGDDLPVSLTDARSVLPVLTALDHPGVLRVEQVVELGGRVAWVYRHVDAASARALLGAGVGSAVAMPARVAVEIVAQVALALEAATSAGTVAHPGCVPEDILVDTAGGVHVAGFVGAGSAAARDPRAGYRPPPGSQALAYMVAALLVELLTAEAPPTAGDTRDRHDPVVRRMLIRVLARAGDAPGDGVGRILQDVLGWEHGGSVGDLGRRLAAIVSRIPGPRLEDWARDAVASAIAIRSQSGPPTLAPEPPVPQAPTYPRRPQSGTDTFPSDAAFDADGAAEDLRFAATASPAGPSLYTGTTDPMGQGAPRARSRDEWSDAPSGSGPRIEPVGLPRIVPAGGVRIGSSGLLDPAPALPSLDLGHQRAIEESEAEGPVRGRGVALSMAASVAMVALFSVGAAGIWWFTSRPEVEVVPTGAVAGALEGVATEPPEIQVASAAGSATAPPSATTSPATTASTSKANPVVTGRLPSTAASIPTVAEPEEPTRIVPTGATTAAVDVPADGPPPPPEPVLEDPGPFSVSFASGDAAISRIEVRCGSEADAGTPPVRVDAAPKGSCKVTGLGGPVPLLTLVTVSADRAYTCFSGGSRSCQ